MLALNPRPFFPGLLPKTTRALVPVAATLASSCTFSRSRNLAWCLLPLLLPHSHPFQRLWLLHSLCTTPSNTHPLSSIGYHKRVASPRSSFNNSKVRENHRRQRPGIHHRARRQSNYQSSFETPPKHDCRCPSCARDGLPLFSLAELLRTCTELWLTILQLSTTNNHKMSLKYFAPVVAIAAGRVAGKRRIAYNRQKHSR